MKANVGDRIVRASGHVDGAVRYGEITGVERADGSPPYRVRWTDTGEESLVYPGTDCMVAPGEGAPAEPAHAHGRTWTVQVTMVERGASTTAEATLVAGEVGSLRAVGQARKDPADVALAVVGDEIAAGRALRRLADALLGQAEADITTSTGIPGHVHR
ncbi:dsRBD fold-containing protein [Xylanimonas protaetiae]|uniref:DUF1876 domain-containing protein n=1 Tax=Xylanimonas protaetiae TaxID=2509457 RepID=A0A4P6F3X9_9MICO|nr:dsRBD fold-containing protein [Xylanimonas protaetiae]QAY70254.1 DUF1876 domain-containing protein [Xylanimonas protaetiae]